MRVSDEKLNRSVIGLIEPGDDLQQARFSRTVAADQSNATLRRQGRRSTIENEVAAQAQRNVFKNEHGGRLVALGRGQ